MIRGRGDLVPRAVAAGYFECPPSWSLALRTRSAYQLWVTVGGHATLSNDAGTRYRLSAHRLMLVPPGLAHQGYHHPGHPLRCFVVHFELGSYGVPIPTNPLPNASVATIDGADWQRAVASARDLCAEIPDAGPDSMLLANAAVGTLVGLFVRHRPSEPPPARRPAAVSSALDMIGHRFADNLSVADLAARAHLSPGHFRHVFRQEVGITPLQYLRRYRLYQARGLLADTELSVGQVAARTGFADPFYFSRAFKYEHGSSPSAYRETVRAESTTGGTP